MIDYLFIDYSYYYRNQLLKIYKNCKTNISVGNDDLSQHQITSIKFMSKYDHQRMNAFTDK